MWRPEENTWSRLVGEAYNEWVQGRTYSITVLHELAADAMLKAVIEELEKWYYLCEYTAMFYLPQVEDDKEAATQYHRADYFTYGLKAAAEHFKGE